MNRFTVARTHDYEQAETKGTAMEAFTYTVRDHKLGRTIGLFPRLYLAAGTAIALEYATKNKTPKEITDQELESALEGSGIDLDGDSLSQDEQELDSLVALKQIREIIKEANKKVDSIPTDEVKGF